MISPRWHKVLTDLWGNKARAILVILSIAIGVFAIGLVGEMYITLPIDLNSNYQAANPYSAIIYSEEFNDDLVQSIAKVPGVAKVEGRSSLTLNMLDKDKHATSISISAIPQVKDIKVSKITFENPVKGVTLGPKDIFIERSALSSFPVKVGDPVTIQLTDGHLSTLRVAAIVYDPTAFPYLLSQQLYAYVSPETMENLGGKRLFTDLYFTVKEKPTDETHVRQIAKTVADKVEKSGRQVFFTLVYQPGVHPAANIMQAILGLLGGLGLLTVFLSGFLVVNTITALLSQHIRQIGVMKSIGATSFQIMMMYLVLVSSFGFLALALALPLSAVAGYYSMKYFGFLLNFDVNGFSIPPVILAIQITVAVGVPILAAILPVWQGTSRTVREALSNYGLAGNIKRTSQSVPFFANFVQALTGFLSRPLLLSLRNTFRRKARLILTLSTLTLGGAIFIAVFNVEASIASEIDKTLGYFLSDINISFQQAYRNDEIDALAKRVPGVKSIEGWGFSSGQMYTPNKNNTMEVTMVAPPASSTLIRPTMTSGRWLLPGDDNALVIGNHVIQKKPYLKVGDEVVIKIKDREVKWRIVGIFLMAGNSISPIVYANADYLMKLRNEVDQSSEFRAITNPNDAASEQRVADNLKDLFKRRGLQVTSIQTGALLREQQVSSINVIIYLLLGMAILIAVVGGLGLMGTMSMNVMERTREIGVMRAIGASDFAILRLVLVEGVLIGLISWGLGTILAIPISQILGNSLGISLLTIPLKLVFSLKGFIYWLITVLVLSGLASFLPARSASRLTIREVLAYE